MPTKPSGTGKIKKKHPALGAIGLLALILVVLFFRSFDPDLVFFSNDGPVGNQVAAMNYVPANIWTGSWQDLNSIGTVGGTISINISILLLCALQWLVGPVLGIRCIFQILCTCCTIDSGGRRVVFFQTTGPFSVGSHAWRTGGNAEFDFFFRCLLGRRLA